MHIRKVTLENIRGFKSLDFDLQRPDGRCAGWTVITGDNGSGKSAVLKAIALGLAGRDTARSLQPSLHRWIRQGAEPYEGSIQLEIVQCDGDDTYAESGRTPESAFPAKLNLNKGGKEVFLEHVIPDGRPSNSEHRSEVSGPPARLVGSRAATAPSVAYLERRRKLLASWSSIPQHAS